MHSFHSFISKSHTAYRLQHIYITYIHYVQINNHVGEWECLWNNMEYGIWFCINNKYVAKKIYIHRHWSDLRIYIQKYSIAHLLVIIVGALCSLEYQGSPRRWQPRSFWYNNLHNASIQYKMKDMRAKPAKTSLLVIIVGALCSLEYQGSPRRWQPRSFWYNNLHNASIQYKMKNMKAKPAKTSEHKALESTKVITHRQSKYNIYVYIIYTIRGFVQIIWSY